ANQKCSSQQQNVARWRQFSLILRSRRRWPQYHQLPDSTDKMTRISAKFEELRREGRKAFIPYITAGDPDLAMTESLLLALADAGTDVIEFGVPFSDPMADGPVIQRASERVKKNDRRRRHSARRRTPA